MKSRKFFFYSRLLYKSGLMHGARSLQMALGHSLATHTPHSLWQMAVCLSLVVTSMNLRMTCMHSTHIYRRGMSLGQLARSRVRGKGTRLLCFLMGECWSLVGI